MMITRRSDALARYRHLRALNLRHQTDAIRFVSGAALKKQAKRLGLTSGQTIVADEEELTYIFDLSLYTASPNRSRAIDRYARDFDATSGSDDAILLQAMQKARFSIWAIEQRHDVAGIVLRDLIQDQTVWLIDEALELSAPMGLTFATRLFEMPEGFSMTCGVSVAVDRDMLTAFLSACGSLLDKPSRETIDDRRFAETLYRMAIMDESYPAFDDGVGMTRRISPWPQNP